MEKKQTDLIRSFKKTIRDFEKKYGQRRFPWRETTDPYRIMVSELMLQQTQTDRVVPKYLVFIEKFPTAKKLADAPQSEIVKLWSGLGYNRRALFLKRAVEIVTKEYDGVFPATIEGLQRLPGIGPYTAAAIYAFAFNKPSTVIETNIRTVFLHHFFADTRTKVDDKELLPLVEKTVDLKNPRGWYNTLMDYGVFLKKSGVVTHRKSKQYTKQSPFFGSLREVRGAILRELSKEPSTEKKLKKILEKDDERFSAAIEGLIKEKFIIVFI